MDTSPNATPHIMRLTSPDAANTSEPPTSEIDDVPCWACMASIASCFCVSVPPLWVEAKALQPLVSLTSNFLMSLRIVLPSSVVLTRFVSSLTVAWGDTTQSA